MYDIVRNICTKSKLNPHRHISKWRLESISRRHLGMAECILMIFGTTLIYYTINQTVYTIAQHIE